MNTLKSDLFSIVMHKIQPDYYSLDLYLSERNILEYTFQEKDHCTFTCHTLTYLVDWLKENLCHILDETDECPYVHVDIPSSEPIMCKIKRIAQDASFPAWETAWNDIQPWYFRHSWLTARDGYYLADVCFRAIGTYVEISWYNYGRYENEGIKFVWPKGVAYIGKEDFARSIHCFIQEWEELRNT